MEFFLILFFKQMDKFYNPTVNGSLRFFFFIQSSDKKKAFIYLFIFSGNIFFYSILFFLIRK